VSLVSINVWRLAGDTLNITCNFLYCNHQVHRDFLITLYLYPRDYFIVWKSGYFLKLSFDVACVLNFRSEKSGAEMNCGMKFAYIQQASTVSLLVSIILISTF
jgi:hypothetical protein